MTIKKALLHFVVLIMMVTIVGCKNNAQTSQVPEDKNSVLDEQNSDSLAKEKDEENQKTEDADKFVELTGDYNYFDKISGFEGSMEFLSMVGEVDNKLILSYIPSDEGKQALLMLVTTDTLTVEKQIAFNDKFDRSRIKFVDNKIIVLLKDKVTTFNTSLNKVEDIPLPEVIVEKINQEKAYKEKGNPNDYFGGYDVSKDMTKFTYSDVEGVKLYDTINKSEKLLSETIYIKGNELIDHSYHVEPYFVADDKKIITIMTVYEGYNGYTLCDLENNTTKFIDIGGYGNSYNIPYDTGILMVNEDIYDDKNQTSETKTLFLEFESEDIIEINIEDTGETDIIRDASHSYVGQNFASFINFTRDGNDNSDSMHCINLLDLSTMKVEPKIISVKAAQTYILGVLNDGSVVFWYDYYPTDENGMGITK